MKSRIYLFLVILFASVSVMGQTLEEEIGFMYVKAEYLYETGRYEEAINEYNALIARDPKYKEALIHRGYSKYAMGAYKGAKADALQSIEYNGITASSAALLGRAFGAEGNMLAAINSLTAAIALDNQKADYFEWRGSFYEEERQLSKACEDYQSAATLGSNQASIKVSNICGGRVPKPGNVTPPVINKPTTTTQPTTDVNDGEVLTDNNQGNTSTTDQGQMNPNNNTDGTVEHPGEVVVVENVPSDDNTVNTIEIDGDLTIDIYGQELGLRRIIEVPSIIILTDKSGDVTVDFCVNKKGEVVSTEFNAGMSTIASKSLVSLALRKAKEFEFAPGKYDSQCGTMIFHMKSM